MIQPSHHVAIIGSGIAGMTCAHRLHPHCTITLYEREDYIGGHTNTVEIDEDGERLPVDTGFMVFNEKTYPNLLRLFQELQVPTRPTTMSFGVQHRPSGLEYCGSDLSRLFAQRRNALNPGFLWMLREIVRFNREAPLLIREREAEGLTLGDFLRRGQYGRYFVERYLLPMTSAIWSAPPGQMLQFPAISLIRFLENHGLLGLRTQLTWFTVAGGSRVYRDRMIAPFRDRILLRRAATAITRTGGRVWVTDASGRRNDFDAVILATHADEALNLLPTPTAREQALLGCFKYAHNTVQLHTDAQVMPRQRRAWAAWNYRIDVDGKDQPQTSTHYWMNALQGVSTKRDYFVSLNSEHLIEADRILRTLVYTHPQFDYNAVRAQRYLSELNEVGPVYFCGSYFRYGFHEDAHVSALDLCRHLLGERAAI